MMVVTVTDYLGATGSEFSGCVEGIRYARNAIDILVILLNFVHCFIDN